MVGIIVKLLQYFCFLFLLSQLVYADDLIKVKEQTINDAVVEIILKDHVFSPAEIRVPAHKKITLVVHNLDPTVEEFDSPALKREKLLKSNSVTNIILAPLAPGRYDFIGEFYQDTAKGTVIVEE